MAERDVSFDGNRMLVLLAKEEGAGMSILDETVPAGWSPPPHAHLHATETFYVLEGSYRFVMDDLEQTVVAGQVVSVPAGITHWWTSGPEGARTLVMFVPGGMEGYFAELSHALAAAGDEPLSDAFRTTMRDRYGMEIRR
jgi:quercetin dioxygenase-like cupin family protein